MEQGLSWIPHYFNNEHHFKRISSRLNTTLDQGEFVLIAGFLNMPEFLRDNPSFPVLKTTKIVLEHGQEPVAVAQIFGRKARPGNAWVIVCYKAEHGATIWFGILPDSAPVLEQGNLLIQLLSPSVGDEGERFGRVMQLVSEQLVE